MKKKEEEEEDEFFFLLSPGSRARKKSRAQLWCKRFA